MVRFYVKILKTPIDNRMNHLQKSLSPLLLWSIGVGNVISGMYFGWNLGLEKGGTYGMAIATGLVIVMYVCFSYSYAELACAIPKAGGGFDYANKAFGKNIGFITGLAQLFIFLFGPPAIAIGIGTNLNLVFPSISITAFTFIAYFIFTLINIVGVKVAARIELMVTIFAILGIVFFAGITLPHFSVDNLQKNGSLGGFSGMFAAIPFAIWFFLGIEGLANVAEESENPQKDLSNGFSRAIITLIILCFLTFVASIGYAGWESVVYTPTGQISDSPLSLVLESIFTKNHLIYQLIIWVSLLGLIASFHGLILAGGRATLEFARYGYGPKLLSLVNEKYKTPANALIFNSLVGILAILSGKTGQIITIAVFGAITMYALSMASLLKLRQSEPNLKRPFRVPLYPILPILALIINIFCFVAMAVYNVLLVEIFIGVLVLSFLAFKIIYKK